jgi:hypothetical protein
MVNAEPVQANEAYPEWMETDWTPRQRVTVIASLLVSAGVCALTAWALMVWGARALAREAIVPIGLTLFTFSAMLLTSVFWYRFRHAYLPPDDDIPADVFASQGLYRLFAVFGMSLALFLILALSTIIIIIGVSSGWDSLQPVVGIILLVPMLLEGFFTFLLAIHSLTTTFTPERDPSAPEQRLDAPARGARLFWRWLVMLLARHSWLLICGALFLGASLNLTAIPAIAWWTPQQAIVILWCATAFYLIAAVIELLPNGRPQRTGR